MTDMGGLLRKFEGAFGLATSRYPVPNREISAIPSRIEGAFESTLYRLEQLLTGTPRRMAIVKIRMSPLFSTQVQDVVTTEMERSYRFLGLISKTVNQRSFQMVRLDELAFWTEVMRDAERWMQWGLFAGAKKYLDVASACDRTGFQRLKPMVRGEIMNAVVREEQFRHAVRFEHMTGRLLASETDRGVQAFAYVLPAFRRGNLSVAEIVHPLEQALPHYGTWFRRFVEVARRLRGITPIAVGAIAMAGWLLLDRSQASV